MDERGKLNKWKLGALLKGRKATGMSKETKYTMLTRCLYSNCGTVHIYIYAYACMYYVYVCLHLCVCVSVCAGYRVIHIKYMREFLLFVFSH